jgi:hypothetical protein
MSNKRRTFIDIELEWAEQQLRTWKEYIDSNPINELKDRIEWRPNGRGGKSPVVVATIEQQGKFIQETMKNYLALLKEVDIMREREFNKMEARSDSNVPTHAKNFLKTYND